MSSEKGILEHPQGRDTVSQLRPFVHPSVCLHLLGMPKPRQLASSYAKDVAAWTTELSLSVRETLAALLDTQL